MEALRLLDRKTRRNVEKSKAEIKLSGLPGKPLEISYLPGAAIPYVRVCGSAFRGAESAHEKNDQAYQQNQAKPAAADHGTAKIEPAAAEQEKQEHQK